jgi:hypothetical protein
VTTPTAPVNVAKVAYWGQAREHRTEGRGRFVTYIEAATLGSAWDLLLSEPSVPKHADLRVVQVKFDAERPGLFRFCDVQQGGAKSRVTG